MGIPTAGMSEIGEMCSLRNSTGLTTLYWWHISVALVVAHEMGHNLGMKHDIDHASGCQCDNDPCIMGSRRSAVGAEWSSCNKQDLEKFFNKGNDHCLRNKPTKLYDSPVCGNGFVETGEECDCGLVGYCNNPCCDPTNCTLSGNNTCGKGLTTEITAETSKKQKGKVFTVITDTKEDWYGAIWDCINKGGDLASIQSEEEYQEVLKQIIAAENRATGGDFWLSGITSDDGATFQWYPSYVDVTYNKWHRSQPDHDVGCVKGHCIEINKRFNNEWNDYCCEQEQFYICQSLITDSSSAEHTTVIDELEYEEKLYDSPVCGNGFLETGEECDCGLVSSCNNPCCDPTNCTLFRNNICANGVSTEVTTEISKKQNSKVFYVITDNKQDWFSARLECLVNGLEMASIESEEEYQEVLKQIIAVDNRTTCEGFWLSDGHCIEINKRFNNEWNDYCCEQEQFYICQSLVTDSSSAEQTTEIDEFEYEEM